MVEKCSSLSLPTELRVRTPHVVQPRSPNQRNVISTPPFIFTKCNKNSQKYTLKPITREITRLRLLVHEFVNLSVVGFFVFLGFFFHFNKWGLFILDFKIKIFLKTNIAN